MNKFKITTRIYIFQEEKMMWKILIFEIKQSFIINSYGFKNKNNDRLYLLNNLLCIWAGIQNIESGWKIERESWSSFKSNHNDSKRIQS
jgi:hypothetical protein